MNANDVLIDLLNDNRRRLHRVFGTMSEECLHSAPDPEANSIAVTVWHMGRLFDVFLTQHVLGNRARNESWFSRGWAERTGYDPRGIGRDGWGSVNRYAREEVHAIPRFSHEQLLVYFDGVIDAVQTYLRETPFDQLLQAGVGFDGRYTRYQIIRMALLDNTRHLGEVFALKAMWQRERRREEETGAVEGGTCFRLSKTGEKHP